MKIILINLARATERLKKMDAQFTALGLPYMRLAATDGASITETDRAFVNNKKRKCFTPYPLSDNELGCWLSHRNAMIEFLRSGETMAAVIEDDAELQPDFAHVLEEIAKRNLKFDFIFLHRKFKSNEKFYPVTLLFEDMQLGIVGPAHMGAIAYIVSREGARKFINYAKQFTHAVDKEIHRYWANGLRVYALSRPVVITNDEGYSYIEETRSQENNASFRSRYPGSNTLFWWGMRKLTRFLESIRKFCYFPGYLYICKEENA